MANPGDDSVLGLDIGGANLKAATATGDGRSVRFPLWEKPAELEAALKSLIRQFSATSLTATMTGELCDCFRTKAEGVSHIVHATLQAAEGRPLHFYSLDSQFITAELAVANPHLVAAANWHALARLAGAFVPAGPALLVDVGSTTSDIIPLMDGEPVGNGRTDSERLLAGELVYSGIGRTNLATIVPTVPFRGRECPVASELFATSQDVFLLLEGIPEDAADTDTADGRPATREFAHERIARLVCADREQFSKKDALSAAVAIADRQLATLKSAAKQATASIGQPANVVLSGSGAFVARDLAEQLWPTANLVSLAQQIGPSASQAACAYAVACLLSE